MASAHLAQAFGLPATAAAAAGFLASAAALLYRYALHGGIKEVLVVALLATGAALGREALTAAETRGWSCSLRSAGAARCSCSAPPGAPYALVLGLLMLAAALTGGRRAARSRAASWPRRRALPWRCWRRSRPFQKSPASAAGERGRLRVRAEPAPPTSASCCGRCRLCRRRASGSPATTGCPRTPAGERDFNRHRIVVLGARAGRDRRLVSGDGARRP